jgi:ABC-type glutathione transport system ATPase component
VADELVWDHVQVRAGSALVLEDATLRVRAGEIVALVGASGSGKTVTARAAVGLLPFAPGRVAGALRIRLGDRTLEPRSDADFRPVRGELVGLLWQDARGALDPLRSVGAQIRAAGRLAGKPADAEALLSRLGFTDAARVAALHPHALSGGMAQRAALAVALARRSRFLLADEPTTGLDPSVQREILTHLRAVAQAGVGLLFITHDLRLLPHFADRVVVMHAGRTAEEARTPAELRGAGRQLLDATRRIAGGAL